ncbi:hypothetical protein AB4455_25600 [Vibrio sp. 10N.261.46.E12]|uniref:hypothetical protein n=1 Tax=unclassified Vibrio TaxID=2614977 RepID=UPI0009756335|nr:MULTISPECIES: hypothetical protein [unclassified Vibrio]OMO36058.1 hypothetical protein BH584_05690 [Vibrio sp. 10N.261.45.E1]PMJ26890.1 hypothetical protein BCU27_08800 [Vibrio sp. 10N.286.45.B6]PML94181.1 hypothetical protein BCT66_24085 [Vibrio sp. 10N.261.49.E11]PMM82883.1 hypothetical protein BCT46_13680 [Vibrio sp. 10N.261.46.E8]PMN46316.1 hypothetical protein BCT32_10655 [Vibrio sp. 10N.261.45.E11]
MRNKTVKQKICQYCVNANKETGSHIQFKFAVYKSGKKALSYSVNGTRWWPVEYVKPISIKGRVK